MTTPKLRQRTRNRNASLSSSSFSTNRPLLQAKKRISILLCSSSFAVLLFVGYALVSYSFLSSYSHQTSQTKGDDSDSSATTTSQLRHSNTDTLSDMKDRIKSRRQKKKPQSAGRNNNNNPPDISPPASDKDKSLLENLEEGLQNILLGNIPTNTPYRTVRNHYNKEVFSHHPKHDTDYNDRIKEKLYTYVHSIRKPLFESIVEDQLPYDVNNCPYDPPEGYPMEWNLVQILHDWKPNNTTFASIKDRPKIYQGICRFTFETDYDKALNYRNKELPFILRDDPRVLQVVERWNYPTYLKDILGKDNKYGTEYSESNHLMFYRDRGGQYGRRNRDWEPPMSDIQMTYPNWKEKATQPIEKMAPDQPHYYFRVNAKKSDHFLYDELPFFKPKENFYIVEAEDTRGINCRFGMNGNIAEAHFDGSRNFVMLFGGERRYILSHPKNCPNMALYARNHPSGRHSKLDWNDPDLTEEPDFVNAMANEVVMQAGDVLYLPTSWFHFIVSLDMNWQCNARSGIDTRNSQLIQQCGFG